VESATPSRASVQLNGWSFGHTSGMTFVAIPREFGFKLSLFYGSTCHDLVAKCTMTVVRFHMVSRSVPQGVRPSKVTVWVSGLVLSMASFSCPW